MADAFFLDAHPSWTQAALDEADQSLIDYLTVLSEERGRHQRKQAQQAEREANAAAHRNRLTGGRRG